MQAGPTLTEDLLGRFQAIVYRKSDLHFPERKRGFLEKRISARLSKWGVEDYETYYRMLEDDPLELDALVGELTTNQTYFFRDPSQFRALKEAVLPELIAEKNREVVHSWGIPGGAPAPGTKHPAMNLRVWSSGCSTGEEAYSIAFTLLDSISYPKAWDIEVVGTDIKRGALDTARKGSYEGASLKGIDPGAAGRYMTRQGDRYTVDEDARRIVRFYESNLKDLSGPVPCRISLKPAAGPAMHLDAEGYFDLIFCRNVMIYFDRDGQQRLVDALYRCLKPGGYLFTGDSEPLHLFRHEFVRSGAGDALYYRKPI